MKNTVQNTLKNSVTKLLGTIAIGGTLVAGLLGSVTAHAAACEMPGGKTLDGKYTQSALFEKKPRYNGGIVFDVKQNGCEVRVKGMNVWSEQVFDRNDYSKPPQRVNRKSSGGTWIFDLSGQKKAVIPAEYIRENSHTPAAAKMTKSLEIYTTLSAEGRIEAKILFDFEYDGAIVKMQVDAPLYASMGNFSFGVLDGPVQSATGAIGATYNTKIQIVPSPELAAKTGSRYLVLRTGANWLLSAFSEQIVTALNLYAFQFYRK